MDPTLLVLMLIFAVAFGGALMGLEQWIRTAGSVWTRLWWTYREWYDEQASYLIERRPAVESAKQHLIIAVGSLIAGGVVVGRRPRLATSVSGPQLGRTAVVSLVLATAYHLLPQSWPGVAGAVVLLALAGFLLHRASRARSWSPTHIAVVGAAPLLLTGLLAFTYDPMIGEVSQQAKYVHNVAMLVIVLLALTIALMRRETRRSLLQEESIAT